MAEFTPDTPINPYAGPPVQGADDPGMLGRILNFALQNREAGMLSPQTRLSLVVPGAGSLLGRVGLQAGAQGVGALARGEGLGEAGKSAATGAVGQLFGESLATPLRLGANASVMETMKAEAAKAAENAAAKNAFNASMANSVNALNQQSHAANVQGLRNQYAETLRQGRNTYRTDKQQTLQQHQAATEAQDAAHQTALAQFGEDAVAKLMDEYKTKVPALGSLPSNTKGYLDAVYGRGPDLVSKEFDAAMKAAKSAAQGKSITVSRDVADALNLKGTAQAADPMMLKEIAKQLGVRKDENVSEILGLAQQKEKITVNAADAIEAMIGKSGSNRKAYHAVADALTEAGVGTEGARAAYKSFRALADYTDKVQGLKGEQANPSAFMGGMTSRPTIDILRRRGEGNIYEGPFHAMRGAPPAPAPLPKPVIPPYQTPPRPTMPPAPTPVIAPEVQAPPFAQDLFKTMKNPLAGHPWIGGMAGGAAAHGLGMGVPGHVAGFTAGAAGSNMMPKELVLRAPLAPETQTLLQNLPSLLAALAAEARARAR